MKQIMFAFVFMTMFILPCALCASETLSADRVNSYNVRKILSKYYSNITVDEDGDICVKTNDCHVYIGLSPKVKTLRVWLSFRAYDKLSRKAMIRLANDFNTKYKFVRVCIRQNGGTVLDWYLRYDGGLNDINLKEMIREITEMAIVWNKFVIEEVE